MGIDMKLHPMTPTVFISAMILANVMIAFGYFHQIAVAAFMGSLILAFVSFMFGVIIGGAIIIDRVRRDQK